MTSPRRCKTASPRDFALAALLLALAPAPFASAQQGVLCKDPRGFCGALIRAECLERVRSEALQDEADPECGGALIAWRSCLHDASECPGVVEPSTPSAPGETRAPCVGGACGAASPGAPAIRDAPDGPSPPAEQQSGAPLNLQ